MNRRKFFQWIGMGTAAAVVAPAVLKSSGGESWQAFASRMKQSISRIKPEEVRPQCMGQLRSQFNEYRNFSEVSREYYVIDPEILKAADELNRRQVEELKRLMAMTGDTL